MGLQLFHLSEKKTGKFIIFTQAIHHHCDLKERVQQLETIVEGFGKEVAIDIHDMVDIPKNHKKSRKSVNYVNTGLTAMADTFLRLDFCSSKKRKKRNDGNNSYLAFR